MDRTPYTYLLKCIPENKYYYGVRWAKGCSPDDFWITYFTSSKYVKDKIKQYGKDAFVFEIRKVFSVKQDALSWEHRVLQRLNAKDREDFYNKTNCQAPPCKVGRRHSEATKQKIRAYNIGRIITQESKDKSRATKLRNNTKPSENVLQNLLFWATQPKSVEHRNNISKATTGKSKNIGSNNPMHGNGHRVSGTKNGRSCSWRVINNCTTEEYIVENLAEFCSLNNIKINTLYNSQEYNPRKRWFLQKIKQNRIDT